MSFRYPGAWIEDGAFNPLTAPPPPSYAYNLISWGANTQGQLGLGNTTYYSSPKQVGSLTTWTSMQAGRNHALAIQSDGTLWSWGQNNYGQLGLGTVTYYSSPKQVGALTNWLKVSAGSYYLLALG